MKLLLDTHILLWSISESRRLSGPTRELLARKENELVFSVASLWEVALKTAQGTPGFRVDVSVTRRNLVENGYEELPITGAHVAGLAGLPAIHKDPFCRMLVAQALVEGVTLITSDATVARYPGPIQRV
jgi:PIN domain nuclease of toxin-antitoxin system